MKKTFSHLDWFFVMLSWTIYSTFWRFYFCFKPHLLSFECLLEKKYIFQNNVWRFWRYLVCVIFDPNFYWHITGDLRFRFLSKNIVQVLLKLRKRNVENKEVNSFLKKHLDFIHLCICETFILRTNVWKLRQMVGAWKLDWMVIQKWFQSHI